MQRFFRWLKALFNRGMDKLEDPEIMLDQAKRDMQEALVSNREKAVQAITQRNRLQQMMDEQVRKSAQLEGQATMALKQNNRDLARQFMREKATTDGSIEAMKPTLAGLNDTVDQVKVAIKRQEEEIRKKLAEALALKAQWKSAQIQTSITKALEGLTFENEYEGSFAAARDRIKDKTSEASARQEMFGTSVAGKVMQMEDTSMDMQADEDLRKLEEKLGMAAPATTSTVTTAPTTDVDAQLDDLEKRLNQGQTPS
ncbi:MAG: PspA/IM30 family protein [Armatimonadetes bacterium]|nr:PspA/IM30 family protein [Armatimonadota bacterium]